MTQPLGIADLEAQLREPQHDDLPDHWYWCRRHERAEHVSEPTIHRDPNHPGHETSRGHLDHYDECVRIGPFMSEREANRLTGLNGHDDNAAVERGLAKPLGMEVER